MTRNCPTSHNHNHLTILTLSKQNKFSLEYIGKTVGISRERTRQVLALYGLKNHRIPEIEPRFEGLEKRFALILTRPRNSICITHKKLKKFSIKARWFYCQDCSSAYYKKNPEIAKAYMREYSRSHRTPSERIVIPKEKGY